MNKSNDSSLDHDTITYLKEATEEMFIEIIETFLSDTPVRLKLLNNALTNNDLTVLTEESHSIKGSSSNIGALKLSALCSVIEKESRNNTILNQAENVRLAIIEFDKVKSELSMIISQQ